MERINVLRKAVIDAMSEHAAWLTDSNIPSVEYQVLTDEKHDKYQLLAVGWEKNERIYYIIFHADIIGEKIWVQEDNTEEGFANLLLKKGINKQDIVLAYYPESHRKFTEFATA